MGSTSTGSPIDTTTTTDSDDFFGAIQNNLNAFSPKNLDIDTADARMEHTGINVKSINIQTILLSILLVIFITIAFIAHLKN